MAILEGTSGNDTIIGTAGNDDFYSYGGDDSMVSGGGNDNFYGDSGKDTIDGGPGNSGVTYAYDTVGINVNLLTNVNHGGYAEGDVLYHINNIMGGTGNDTIVGNNNGDLLNGGGGSDNITGGTGNDYSNAGDGNNTIDGGAGNDTLIGGTGNDQFYGGTGDDSMVEGGGNGSFYGDSGKDTIDGGTGNSGVTYAYDTVGINVNLLTNVNHGGYAEGDVLYHINNIMGGTGNDTIVGNNNGDLLNGGAGNDIITGGTGNDYSDAGDGNDSVNGSGGNDSIVGGAGNDTLDGGEGNDTLTGSLGADIFVVGVQANTADVITDFSTSTAGEQINLTAFGYTNFFQIKSLMTQVGGDVQIALPSTETLTLKNVALASLNYTHFVGVTNSDGIVTGTAGNDLINTSYTDVDGDKVTVGNDTILALGGDDSVLAGAGNDSIDGGSGNDTLEGGAGADTLIGGLGINTLSYAHDTSGVHVDLSTQTASGGEAQGDIFSGMNAVIGGVGSDYLAGSIGNDSMFGNGGNDTFSTGAGNDLVVVGNISGSTTPASLQISLGDGADSIGEAAPIILLVPPVNIYSTINLDGGTGNDTLSMHYATISNATITGGDGDDSISFVDRYLGIGSDGKAINAALLLNGNIDGGTGNDTINADSTGYKFITGGAGNDSINFNLRQDATIDSIDSGTGNDTVTLVSKDPAQNYVGGNQLDQLYVTLGDGNDVFQTSASPITTARAIIDGGNGNDTLHGTGNTDTLIGGNGADVLYGANGGADTFFVPVNAPTEEGDVIYNFVSGEDHLHLITASPYFITQTVTYLRVVSPATQGLYIHDAYHSGDGVFLLGVLAPLAVSDFV